MPQCIYSPCVAGGGGASVYEPLHYMAPHQGCLSGLECHFRISKAAGSRKCPATFVKAAMWPKSLLSSPPHPR